MVERSSQGLDATGRSWQVGQADAVVKTVIGKCLVRMVCGHHPHPIHWVASVEAICGQWFAEPAVEPVHPPGVWSGHWSVSR